LYVALLVFAFSLLTWLASPVSICAKRKPASSSGSGKWAVILSPGPQTGVPWGGYHVTITGYSNANGGPAKRDSLKNAFNSVFHGTPWHLHGNLPALKNWKGTYTQIVKSRTLDDLADRLVAEGFDRVKGPSHSGTPWHISLNGDHAASKRKVEAFKHGKTNWYLWQVPEPDKACQDHGTGCPRWQKIH
jgi:hypothetical protein